MATQKELRVVVIGDELVAGAGDPKALGWSGRVLSRTEQAIRHRIAVNLPERLMHFELAVPGEGTAALNARWEAEAMRRFGPVDQTDNRLVVGLGWADARDGVSLARARLNLADILDRASSLKVRTFVVGPPPSPDPTIGVGTENNRIAALNDAYAEVAARRGVPYVDCYRPLVNHEQWRDDIATSPTKQPGQAGYGLMAWLVLHHGWQPWLGLPDES